jgi:nicotinamidase-related amidase
MQRYFTQPSFPFTEVFEKLSPGSTAGYLKRVREIVIPSIQSLLHSFRAIGSPVVFTAVGRETGDGRELPGWLRSFDELGLATLGKRVWPAVGDPSWEIDEAANTGRDRAQKAFGGHVRYDGSRATASSSANRVRRYDGSIQ